MLHNVVKLFLAPFDKKKSRSVVNNTNLNWIFCAAAPACTFPMWALRAKKELKCLLQVWHVCVLPRLAAGTRGGGWLWVPSWTVVVRSTVGGRGGRSVVVVGALLVPSGVFVPLAAFDAGVMQIEVLFLRASGIWSIGDLLSAACWSGLSGGLLFNAVVTVMPLSFSMSATIYGNVPGLIFVKSQKI